MRYIEINIGGYQAKVTKVNGTPLIEVSEGYVDKNGNEIVEEVIGKRESVWKNKDGQIVEERFKLVNGKPTAKFKLIKEVPKEKIRIVPKAEAYDLLTEAIYKVDCPLLYEKLLADDTAYKYLFSMGNGFKLYLTYLTTFGKDLVMYLGIDTLSNGLAQLDKVKQSGIKVKPKEEVARANELLSEIAI